MGRGRRANLARRLDRADSGSRGKNLLPPLLHVHAELLGIHAELSDHVPHDMVLVLCVGDHIFGDPFVVFIPFYFLALIEFRGIHRLFSLSEQAFCDGAVIRG